MDGRWIFNFQYQAYGIFIKAIYPMYDNSILAGELYALLGYGLKKLTMALLVWKMDGSVT